VTWAAKAKLLGAYGRPASSQLPPVSAIGAASAAWAAKAKLLDAYGRPVRADAITPATGSSFDWNEFGIGLGAMLGLVLLTGGLAGAVYHSRRSHAQTHAPA
jgi:hypothetical protein